MLGTLVALPIGLGLLGFLEPCSIGSTLLFIRYLEGQPQRVKVAHALLFTAVRASFMGGLGVLAVAIGARFVSWQRIGWIALGVLYIVLGILSLMGRGRFLNVSIGPQLRSAGSRWRTGTLGVLFGLNVPACAAPLLFALFGMTAAGGAGGTSFARGFISLGLFGLALSLPLVIAVASARGQGWVDRIAMLSRRLPAWTGALLVLLGVVSVIAGLRAGQT